MQSYRDRYRVLFRISDINQETKPKDTTDNYFVQGKNRESSENAC